MEKRAISIPKNNTLQPPKSNKSESTAELESVFGCEVGCFSTATGESEDSKDVILDPEIDERVFLGWSDALQ